MSLRTTRSRFALLATLAFLILVAPASYAQDPATLPANNPVGPRYPEFIPGVMIDSVFGDDACSDLVIQQGWELVNPDDVTTPRRLEGEVVAGHPPHGDFNFNHNAEDYTFYVFPDNHIPFASDPTADYRYLIGSGNFEIGEPKAKGLIEVEWEYGAHSWNDAASANYYGFPSWAWPNLGDRVLVEGFWVFDCGHGGDSGSAWRTEIHPARLVVTYRNMVQSQLARASYRKGSVAPLGTDDRDFSPVTRADIFASSYGGEVVDNLFDDDVFYGPNLNPPQPDWWQPVNDKNYVFDILAPDRPSDDAVLVWQVLDPPSDYQESPSAVHPPFDPAIHIVPILRPDLRQGVRVTIPFASLTANSNYMVFAKTILVGWDVPQPDVMHFRVDVKRWNIHDDLEPEIEETEYSAWALSRGQNIFVRVTDGGEDDEANLFECDSDGNFMPQCDIDSNENSFADGTFDLFIRPEDSLGVTFRAKEGDVPFNENDDFGIAEQAFTAAESWGVGTHFLEQSDATFAGEHPDFFAPEFFFPVEHNPCIDTGPNDEDSCFEVTYTIERIFDPTTLTIGLSEVQYAQDPNHYTATVITPGPPDKPRRRLPVGIALSGPLGTQVVNGVTAADGVAAPATLLTLPGGEYTNTSVFAGNGLLIGSSDQDLVTILKDYTASALEIADEIRWGHRDPMTVTLIEPNVHQSEPQLPIGGKHLTITLTGPLGTETFDVGPTSPVGTAQITPLLMLPPGDYEATACFAEDPWFLGSCSDPQPVRVTAGFALFARGGPIRVSGTTETALGDMHSEGSIVLNGSTHTLSAAPGEKLTYVTTFTDGSVESSYNLMQVPAFGQSPQYLASTYCNGASSVMGVPVTYFTEGHTFHNRSTMSGIYCVTGDIKIQSGVSGSAVLVASGKITTSGGGQALNSEDPFGAEVLMLAGSADDKAISVGGLDATFNGALVATGGIEVKARRTSVTTALIARQIIVEGELHVIDGR